MSKKYTTIIRRDKSVIDINDDIHEVKDLKERIKLQSIENERLCNVVKEIQNGIDIISSTSCSLQDILKQREAVINELTLKLSNLSSTYEDRIIKLEEKIIICTIIWSCTRNKIKMFTKILILC